MSTNSQARREGADLRGRIARYGALAGAIGLAAAQDADAVPVTTWYGVTVDAANPSVLLDADGNPGAELEIYWASGTFEAYALEGFLVRPARSGVHVIGTPYGFAASSFNPPPFASKPYAEALQYSHSFRTSGPLVSTAILWAQRVGPWGTPGPTFGVFFATSTTRFAGFRVTGAGSSGLGFIQLHHRNEAGVHRFEVQATLFDPGASFLHADPVPQPVPEPSSLALLAAGAAGVAALRRRRRKAPEAA